MNINDLTIGQAKELSSLFGNSQASENIRSEFIGLYVICRSRNEGINAGKVLRADETGVVLEDARRIYYHKPLNKNKSWYEGVADSGLSNDSKISGASLKMISEDYSLTVCAETAERSIRNAKENHQN
ncbi:MAG: hypothetical protein JKY22_11955 [Flavobacteriaceae bacterium]|nr:hypothetical protein [Flavobacteriaceae bacterium]